MKDKFNDRDEDKFFFSFGFPPFKYFWNDFHNFFNVIGRNHPWFSSPKDRNQFRRSFPFTEVQEDNEKYLVFIELPGISKDDINLEITTEELWLEAKSEEYKRRYLKHLFFRNPINIDETRAVLKSGILKIQAPFEKKIEKTKLKID